MNALSSHRTYQLYLRLKVSLLLLTALDLGVLRRLGADL